jgi:uncharacterized peroxidase-related enzyme
MGEFRGDDARSPIKTKVQISMTALRKYRPESHAVEPFDDTAPLEANVERRPSHAQRRAAFDNAGLAEPLSMLIDKVAKHAYKGDRRGHRRGAGTGPQRGPDLRDRGLRRDRPGHAAVRHGARGPRGRDREGLSMRLAILDSGHGFGRKALFAFIRVVTRQPVVDAVKLVLYRPDFYGTHMKEVTHEAMRGPSAWSVGDRELMAAFVSTVNECEFCIKAHAAVAASAYHDDARVSAALSDLETAPIEEPLRATLRLLRKLTREHTVDVDDMRAVLAAGVSRQQIEDALAVCFAFNTTDRLADTFEFFVPGPKAFEAGAKFLLARGYR